MIEMSTCNKCGARFPKAGAGVFHKCHCSDGMMIPDNSKELEWIGEFIDTYVSPKDVTHVAEFLRSKFLAARKFPAQDLGVFLVEFETRHDVAPHMDAARQQLKNDSQDDFMNKIEIDILAGNRLDRNNAAKALGRTPKTLAEWKCKGVGPRPINVGGRMFYDLEEVMQMARGEKPIKPSPLEQMTALDEELEQQHPGWMTGTSAGASHD